MSPDSGGRLVFVRLLPVVLVVVAVGLWFVEVENGGPWVSRNLAPLVILVLLSWWTLRLGDGHWVAAGWKWLLGTAGFAIPALGLSAYLHYAYSVNLNGMFTGAPEPAQLFRYLPIYTVVAGGLGFAIGWIVGKRV
jgi:hypothetical protein